MAPQLLEGRTLGDRHKCYNKLLKDAIANKETIVQSTDLNIGEDDLNNLLKIDIACSNKDVEYIVEALKSEDMLYVSRAVKRCTWLITDRHYAHIINPEYLHSQLFPHMSSKAYIKLMKQIRLHLKDESRCEEFYKNEIDVTRAVKWLPNCSISFIEKAVKEHSKIIKTRLLKRLCERSISILELDLKNQTNSALMCSRLERTKFLLNTDTEKYLDILEKLPFSRYPKIGAKLTEIIMKKFPDRIIKKFEIYYKIVDLSTFLKYVKKEDVKHFLYELAKNEKLTVFLRRFENVRSLIAVIPENERFPFVKDIFIDKIHSELKVDDDQKIVGMRQLYCIVAPHVDVYRFYEFAPFDTALREITKLIKNETVLYTKRQMFQVLVTCAGRNLENIHKIVKYIHDEHIYDNVDIKCNFINILLKQTSVHKYGRDSFELLNVIFENMDVYNKLGSEVQDCVETIILYKAVHGENVPEVVEEKFKWKTMKEYEKKLNKKEKEMVFNYLYIFVTKKIQEQSIKNEEEFKVALKLFMQLMELLTEWKKDIIDYSFVHNQIKELIRLRKDKQWDIDLKDLYKVNKTWRKHMFEESFELCPSEKVCINSLKHGPELLKRHQSEVERMQRDDTVSLRRLLSKVRIYWPHSLASEWTTAYLDRMNQQEGTKALICGLCALLPRQPLLEIIQKFAPKQAKIDFGVISEIELNLQREIARNMHIARPQPSPEAILLYAKGDYLQYALPSLLAIFYNINVISTQEYIFNFLDAPVSLQKHGIRFAFSKLQTEALKNLFGQIWKQTNNATIRSNIIQCSFRLLCRETNSSIIIEIWGLLETFIDALSYEEDKATYLLLTGENVKMVPLTVRADYYMKSYKFLKRLIPILNKEDGEKYMYYLSSLTEYAREIMEYLPSDFMVEILQELISADWLKPRCYSRPNPDIIPVISAYLLCGHDEPTQTERFNNILIPLLQQSHSSWNEINERNYFMRTKVQELLEKFGSDLKDYVVEKNMIVPVKLFTDIQIKLSALPVCDNYVMLTLWKLTVELAKIIDQNGSDDNWDARCAKATQEFSKKCILYLKEDVKLYFPNIFVLFSKALQKILNLLPASAEWDIYKQLVTDQDCIQAYLTTINLFPLYVPEETKKLAEELRQDILKHPSVEVKLHYYHKMGVNE